MSTEKPKYTISVDSTTKPTVTKGNIKIGNTHSFSLLPGDDPIRTSKELLTDIKGTCSGVCAGCKDHCYAMRDARLYNHSTIPAWGKNTLLTRLYPDQVIKDLDEYIKDPKNKVERFRFHVSGEVESYEYLEKLNKLCEDNPKVKFGMYTKRFDFVQRFLNEHKKFADNFCVNISEWNHNTDGYNFEGLNKFVWDDGSDPEIAKLIHCPAVSAPTKPGGKGHETGVTCDKCGRCYKTTGKRVAVYNH